jgi:hypothetical protein
MNRRKLLLVGILLVALVVAAWVGYWLLQREPVYGGKPRSYWKEQLFNITTEMSPPSTGWFAKLVWQANPWKKPTTTAWGAREHCEASAELLAEMLDDPDPEFREMAGSALVLYYPRSPEAWTGFLQSARDRDDRVRHNAFWDLFAYRQRWTPAMIEDFLGLLTDRDTSVRERAWWFLQQEREVKELISKALQQRTVNADEARLLQELLEASPAAGEGPSR